MSALFTRTIESVKDLREVKPGFATTAEEAILFTTSCGRKFLLRHAQDCCESVTIHSIAGDLQSLIGQRITIFKTETDNQLPEGFVPETEPESFSRTIITINNIVITCVGLSNGCYDETMQCEEIE